MAKSKTRTAYLCQECGAKHVKWQGQCFQCQQWGTLVEEIETPKAPLHKGWVSSPSGSNRPIPLQQTLQADEQGERWPSGYPEFDRVLGGGLVPGSFVLLGGDPGVGKSTLLLQIVGALAESGKKCLYVSGEESISQTGLRARRLNITKGDIKLLSEGQLELILRHAEKESPNILIVDSIQTVFLPELGSAPGTVSQVRECAARLMGYAKSQHCSVFLVGHVTKEGSLAGPKVLEHMVDTVLSFEGDVSHQFRLLRSLKNRFGAANEIGVYEMSQAGMQEVTNPSELFLADRGQDLIGSVVFASMEGSRPLLCEVQALTQGTPLAMPRRTSVGVDLNRIHLLAAVLSKVLDLPLAQSDIFVNIVGGLRINEPAADLAMAAALISSEGRVEIHPSSCYFGEIGLTGEIRPVSFPESRLKEAAKLGFHHFFLPQGNQKHLERELSGAKNVQLHWLKHIRELPGKMDSLL